MSNLFPSFHIYIDRSKEASSEGDDFDQNAAFFTKVVSKKKKAGTVPETTSGGKNKSNKETKKEEEVSLRINFSEILEGGGGACSFLSLTCKCWLV